VYCLQCEISRNSKNGQIHRQVLICAARSKDGFSMRTQEHKTSYIERMWLRAWTRGTNDKFMRCHHLLKRSRYVVMGCGWVGGCGGGGGVGWVCVCVCVGVWVCVCV